MQEMSMPRMTDALTLWWLRMIMANTPTSMVTTYRTIWGYALPTVS